MEIIRTISSENDIIDEGYYVMLSGYKDGCLIEIGANPIIYIYKNRIDGLNRNFEIKVPLFV